MVNTLADRASGNRLLALLPEDEHRRLSPLFQVVPLDVKQVLCKARSPIDYVYFPLSGMISAMTVMEDGNAIEIATIGSEGMSGLTAFVGGQDSPHEMMVQMTGRAVRMTADLFKREVAKGGPLNHIMVQYHTAFAVQVSYAVACNGLHTIDKRCCRWLLMTQDRVGSRRLNLTHELLAIMLGVRRPSVTEALAPLQKSGVIGNGRGTIEILDRAALLARSCECYQAVKDEFSRLLGYTDLQA